MAGLGGLAGIRGGAYGFLQMTGPNEARPAPVLTAEILLSPALSDLGLTVVAGERGMNRLIAWGRIQRPGLAFAGFLAFIKPGRIQILG